MTRALRLSCLVAGAAATLVFAIVALLRLRFPYELEWMTGSVLDHVDRVRAGQPVYAAPTPEWIPYLYPPLYFWIASLLPPGFVACRLVSLVATLVQAACIYRLGARASKTRYWGLVAAGLFFAAYAYVGTFYDIERSDTLFVAMMLVATVALVEVDHFAGALLAGAIVGVGFFAKQPALLFAAAGTIALLASRKWARAASFGLPAAAVVLAGTRLLDARTGGWFSYYVLTMPASHGIERGLLGALLLEDFPTGIVILGATFGVFAMYLRGGKDGASAATPQRGLHQDGTSAATPRRGLHQDGTSAATPQRGLHQGANAAFVGMLAAGFVAGTSSRLHVGGWINVLQPWTSFACVAVAAVGPRAEAWLAARTVPAIVRGAPYAAVLLQFALWAYNPARTVPDARLADDTRRFHEAVARLETRGEVLLVGRGHVTRQPHFQMSGIADVVRTEGKTPPTVIDAVLSRRFAAIVDDAREADSPPPSLWPPVMLEDIADLRAPLLASYFVAERFDEPSLRIVMRAPAQPRWVLYPRKRRLDLAWADLKKRQLAEMALASKRLDDAALGKPVSFAADDIEQLAGTPR